MVGSEETAEDPIAVRKRRVRFRCWHRGTKELDLLMGPFVDRFLAELTPAQLDQLEHLLTVPDLDLYNWITKRAPVPADANCGILDVIIDFHNDR
ncbi:MAG: succinate dehydrogenase assembly factor 2 [Alphaproteobacteria bacterium]|nr:succinate dehydrogenase assembly factor 2 [Alphaproteobacteria bacterium]